MGGVKSVFKSVVRVVSVALPFLRTVSSIICNTNPIGIFANFAITSIQIMRPKHGGMICLVLNVAASNPLAARDVVNVATEEGIVKPKVGAALGLVLPGSGSMEGQFSTVATVCDSMGRVSNILILCNEYEAADILADINSVTSGVMGMTSEFKTIFAGPSAIHSWGQSSINGELTEQFLNSIHESYPEAPDAISALHMHILHESGIDISQLGYEAMHREFNNSSSSSSSSSSSGLHGNQSLLRTDYDNDVHNFCENRSPVNWNLLQEQKTMMQLPPTRAGGRQLMDITGIRSASTKFMMSSYLNDIAYLVSSINAKNSVFRLTSAQAWKGVCTLYAEMVFPINHSNSQVTTLHHMMKNVEVLQSNWNAAILAVPSGACDNKHIVFGVIRGSDSTADWISQNTSIGPSVANVAKYFGIDMNIMKRGDRMVHDMKSLFQLPVNSTNYPAIAEIVLTGHSLGGYNAHVAAQALLEEKFSGDIPISAYCFNAGGPSSSAAAGLPAAVCASLLVANAPLALIAMVVSTEAMASYTTLRTTEGIHHFRNHGEVLDAGGPLGALIYQDPSTTYVDYSGDVFARCQCDAESAISRHSNHLLTTAIDQAIGVCNGDLPSKNLVAEKLDNMYSEQSLSR